MKFPISLCSQHRLLVQEVICPLSLPIPPHTSPWYSPDLWIGVWTSGVNFLRSRLLPKNIFSQGCCDAASLFFLFSSFVSTIFLIFSRFISKTDTLTRPVYVQFADRINFPFQKVTSPSLIFLAHKTFSRKKRSITLFTCPNLHWRTQ